MDTRTCAALLLLILLASSALAQDAFTEWALKDMQWRIESIVKLILCAIWAITAATLTIVVIISGIRYLTSQDADEKDKAKKNIKQGFVGLIIIAVACPFVNYLVHGTDVKEFKCDCIPLPPPTSTTTTTTTIPIGAPGTRPTTTSTTTTTTVTIVTTLPKSGGGRFLLVGVGTYNGIGNGKICGPCGYSSEQVEHGEVCGVIFNMDGSIHKEAFHIDYDQGPVALAVGPNRFFVAYGENAVVLNWEGEIVKDKFTTKSGNRPVKAIQTQNKFYLLLSPDSGGCVIQVYDLNGNLQNTYTTDINKIDYVPAGLYYFQVYMPAADMALGEGKLFIVWSESINYTESVNAIAYDLSGKKIKDKFTIKEGITPFWTSFVFPVVEAGSKNFLVMFDGGTMMLYDINSLDFVAEKTFDFEFAGLCVHDLVYGDGKFLAACSYSGTYYDEDGNQIGTGYIGGHYDCPTTLAYGNHMFVGIVATHNPGDGIGASFLDSNGNHLIDVMPLEMPETPGWAAYDW